jgi:hypothetical protein
VLARPPDPDYLTYLHRRLERLASKQPL